MLSITMTGDSSRRLTGGWKKREDGFTALPLLYMKNKEQAMPDDLQCYILEAIDCLKVAEEEQTYGIHSGILELLREAAGLIDEAITICEEGIG